MGKPEPGDVFTVTIDRISKSGNAIVVGKRGEDRFNIGRADCMQGDEVEVEYVGNGVAYCLDADRRGEKYNVSKESGLIKGMKYRTPMNSDQKRDSKNDLLNNLR